MCFLCCANTAGHSMLQQCGQGNQYGQLAPQDSQHGQYTYALTAIPCAGEAVAEVIRRRVREEVALTCSCGIGPNRLLAKVASDIRKPDGQFAIPGNTTAIIRFIDLLPIRKVPGIGKVGRHPNPLVCSSHWQHNVLQGFSFLETACT